MITRTILMGTAAAALIAHAVESSPGRIHPTRAISYAVERLTENGVDIDCARGEAPCSAALDGLMSSAFARLRALRREIHRSEHIRDLRAAEDDVTACSSPDISRANECDIRR